MNAVVAGSVFALVFLVGPIAMVWFALRAEWKFTPTQHEAGLTLTATFRTAGRTVDGHATWPFVRVTTYPGLVVIVWALDPKPIVLRASDAIRVERGRSFLFRTRYLKLVCTRAVAPVPILVWPRPHQHDALEAAVRASLDAPAG